jgi:transposase-like protein
LEKLICPACGSSNLVKSNYHEYVTENLGGQVLIDKVLYQCPDCGSEGDFFNENELAIEKALSDLKNKLVVSILDGFTENKVSLSSIERALDLPQRTLTKWKNGASSPTSAGIALLKFIKLFPWLLEVAENKFDYEISQKIFMGNAFQKMISKMTFIESEFKEAGVITSANSTFLYIHMHKNEDINAMGYGNITPMVTIS